MREYWLEMRRAVGGDIRTYVFLCFRCSSSVHYLPIDPLSIVLSSFLPYRLILYISTGHARDCAAESRPHEKLREHRYWDTYHEPSTSLDRFDY